MSSSLSDTGDSIEAFKNFLAARPTIKEIIFSIAGRPAESSPSAPKSSPTNTREMLFYGAESGDQFFVRLVGSEKEINQKIEGILGDAPKPFGGRFGSNFFLCGPGLVKLSPVSDASVETTVSRDSRGAKSLYGDLNGALNFGIFGGKRDSFRWDGNDFTFRITGVDEKIIQLYRENGLTNDTTGGKLQSESGVAKSIILSNYPVRIEYEYLKDSTLPAGIPSKFTVFKEGQVVNVYMIKSLITQQQPLSEGYFDPDRFFDRKSMFRVSVGTNGLIIFHDKAEKMAHNARARKYYLEHLQEARSGKGSVP